MQSSHRSKGEAFDKERWTAQIGVIRVFSSLETLSARGGGMVKRRDEDQGQKRKHVHACFNILPFKLFSQLNPRDSVLKDTSLTSFRDFHIF